MSSEDNKVQVSPNNPCPFLRASVQQKLLDNHLAKLQTIADTVNKVAKTGTEVTHFPALEIKLVAAIANGLNPLSVFTSLTKGVRLDELRDGPLDKHGVGSGILDKHAVVQESELERLATFASEKTATDGSSELGLSEEEITHFMDENFARAKGHRRKKDRKLMNGEWPALLKLMGKDSQTGKYLSVADVRTLFIHRVFPERMMDRLKADDRQA